MTHTEAAVRASGWRVISVAGDHNAHATQPARLVPMLERLVAESAARG